MKKMITKGVKSMGSSDIALTYWHAKEMIAVLDLGELLIQLKHWKQNNIEVRKSNVRQYDVGGKSVYLFVVQPVNKELLAECNICPFSASLGLMVAGVGYVCTSRDVLNLVIRYIGVEGATKNPIFE
jgi:hypothetical protein